MVYEDWNENELRDDGEPGIAGAIIALSTSDGRPLTSQGTGEDGIYSFDGLSPGDYCLDRVNPPGFVSSSVDSMCLPFLNDGDVREWDFRARRLLSVTPSNTSAETATRTPTCSETVPGLTATATSTPEPSSTPTETRIPTLTLTPTLTRTPRPSLTPTETPISWIDAGQAGRVYCKGVFEGDTRGKPNNAHHYGNPSWPETGPEDVHLLQKTVTSDLVVSIECLAGDDLDVFLLYEPYPEAVLAQGDRGFTARNLAPGTYYIVVDGYGESDMGPYRLFVDCEGEPTLTPTATLSPSPTNTLAYSYGPLLLKMSTPTPTNTPTPTLTPTFIPYDQAVNCGGDSGFQASDGYRYAPDQPYTPGSWGWQGAPNSVSTTDRDIRNTYDDPLYQVHRHSVSAYRFTVPAGRYHVVLRFAEVFPYTHVGDRVFSVDLEGQRVLSRFDVRAQVPLYYALDKEFEVNVVDGVLDVTFEQQSSDWSPAINGIRVKSIGPPH